MGLYVTLAAAAAPGLLLLSSDNSPQVFFPRMAEERAQYERFTASFGRDSGVRLAATGPGLWTPQGLQWLADLEQRAASTYGVAGVAGLYTHHAARFPAWPPDPETFRRLVLADPLDSNAGWVNGDGSTVTILLALADLPPDSLEELLLELEQLPAPLPPSTEAWVAGLPVVQQAMDQALVDFLSQYFPLLIFLVVGVLVLVFRRFAHLLPPLLLVGICELTVLGAIGYSGESLNVVSILLVPLLMVIALATATHVLLRFRRHRWHGLAPDEALRETFKEKVWPVLWAGATTAIAFGSLLASPVPPVRALGIWSAVGMALITLATLTLYPALLALGRPGAAIETTTFERWGRNFGRKTADWAIRRRRLVFLGFALTALVWVAGATRMSFDTNLLSYFRDDQVARRKIERLEAQGIGPVAAELVLDSGVVGEPLLEEARVWERLGELTAELRSQPGVQSVVSASEVIASWEQERRADSAAFNLPERGPFPIGNLQLLRLLPFLITPDGRQARISMLLPMRSLEELEPVFRTAVSTGQRFFPDREVHVTGLYPLVLAAQRSTLDTMMESFSIALLLVGGIFCFLLGSARIGIKALLPNLWPVLFVLGAMGWMQVPLDSTTVTIAAVALGLVVDDTLHTLGLYRRLAVSSDPAVSLVSTLEETAGAHCLSSLLLAGGFAVCAFSDFLPVARFGALSAAAIIMALAGDLILMPPLLAGSRAQRPEC